MTTTHSIDWAAATAAVDRAERILLVSHVSPDGDAMGSLVGLSNALRERGHKVTAAIDGGVPGFARFLPHVDQVQSKLDSGHWDLMISVDSSDEERSGLVGEYGRAHSPKVINLDHHVTNTMFGDIHLVMPSAVSATEVIFHWLHEMEQAISTEVAIPLLTGLVTDTLGFRTSNVTSDTLRIAVDLMDAGASLPEIMARTLSSKAYRILELWKRGLATVVLHGEVIEATLSREAQREAGMDETSDGGLVGFLNTVNEARIAVIFKELEDGDVEISLRSKPGYNVAEVALSVGGGGHPQASGATIAGPLSTARERILPLLQTAVSNGNKPQN